MSNPANIAFVSSIANLRLIPTIACGTQYPLVVVGTKTYTASTVDTYVWNATSSAADNGTNVIKPADQTGNGRWVVINLTYMTVGGYANLNQPPDDPSGVESISTNGNNAILSSTGYGTGADAIIHGNKADGTQSSPTSPLAGEVVVSFGARTYCDIPGSTNFAGSCWASDIYLTQNATGLVYPACYQTFETAATNVRLEGMRLTQNRALLVNMTDEYAKFCVAGDTNAAYTAAFFSNAASIPSSLVAYIGPTGGTYASGQSTAGAAAYLYKDTTTSRSLNAAGTLNATGADYADYETKNPGVTFQKGQVVGYDSDGYLTDRFSLSVAFGIKSTDPSFVGGDCHVSDVGERPSRTREPMAPKDPKKDTAFAALYLSGNTSPTPEQLENKLEELKASHQSDISDFHARHTSWLADLETLAVRQAAYDASVAPLVDKVDRIAKSGKVPAIVTGKPVPGQFVDASAGPGDTIVLIPMKTRSENSVGKVRVTNPSKDRIYDLISSDVPYNSLWNAIIDVIQ